LSRVRPFAPGDETGIRAVLEAALAVDRYPGITAADIERRIPRLAADPAGIAVALEGDRIVGIVQPRGDDLTVHPDHRRRGHGRALAAAGRDIVRAQGLDELRLYVPPHLPGSVAFAEALGFRYVSSLWLFELDAGHAVPGPQFAPTVAVRPLRWDEDLDRYVAFMNEAFRGHPSPMSWTVGQIRHVHELPDFDPTLILLVADATDPDRLVGFTVLETNPAPAAEDGGPTGSVGLVGVVPAWRGRGLGRELLRWAVGELRRRGIEPIDLSVEAENEAATRLYRAHGFRPAVEWPHWVLPAR
jgi:mycothiol synthase